MKKLSTLEISLYRLSLYLVDLKVTGHSFDEKEKTGMFNLEFKGDKFLFEYDHNILSARDKKQPNFIDFITNELLVAHPMKSPSEQKEMRDDIVFIRKKAESYFMFHQQIFSGLFSTFFETATISDNKFFTDAKFEAITNFTYYRGHSNLYETHQFDVFFTDEGVQQRAFAGLNLSANGGSIINIAMLYQSLSTKYNDFFGYMEIRLDEIAKEYNFDWYFALPENIKYKLQPIVFQKRLLSSLANSSEYKGWLQVNPKLADINN